jgi:hypothetical protein
MRTFTLLLLVLVAAGACGEHGLDDARARWRRAAIADYAFDYRTTGFAAGVNVHITVRNGAATNVDDLGGGPVPSPTPADVPTIETLFDKVERELEGDANVDVMWDPMLGYPVHAYFDEGEEGEGFTVNSFQSAIEAR